MKYIRISSSVIIFGVAALAAGCNDKRVDGLVAAQTRFDEQVAQMETRLQTLEQRPLLDFTLRNTHTAINEKMFTPLVVASSQLLVSGEKMPPTFYVDVMLKVEVPHIQYESIERQIFPVVDGRSKLQLQQKLPQHGLKPEQVKVTLKPMTWYRGQIIDDDRVKYL